jgi:hypothetical protein
VDKIEESKILERIAWLDLRIAATPHWGARLSAMDEERKGLLDRLGAKSNDC